MAKPSLSAALAAGRFVVAPGLHDMISAVIFNKVGFDFAYASGYWLTASAYGLPDAGIASYTQMVDRVRTLCNTVSAGVIADADTGYGGLLNVHHTVQGYEAAGVVAIQIEDQEFPKKCGHTPFKRVVPTIDMVEKVKVACDARKRRLSSGPRPMVKRAPTFFSSKRSKARTRCARPAGGCASPFWPIWRTAAYRRSAAPSNSPPSATVLRSFPR